MTGGPPVVNAYLQGAKIKIIGGAVNLLPYTFIATAAIRNPEQLKGKKIGISRFGSNTDYVVRLALNQFALAANDVQVIQVGGSQARLVAMKSGAIQATVLSPEETAVAQKMGYGVLLDFIEKGIEFPHVNVVVRDDYLESQPQTARSFMQALISGAVEAICVAPPHDLMLKKMGYPALAGPPEVGLPSAGMLTSDRLIKENPQVVRRTLKALLRSHLYILDNRQETIQTLIKWLPQPLDIAEHSYDGELKTLSKDGTMTDAEIETIIARVGEKKRPLDEVRDFSFARQAMKELEAGK